MKVCLVAKHLIFPMLQASHVLRKETKIDHENAEQENQPKARKKRVKRTLLNNQKVKKRKLAQKPKTADNAEEQEMEVICFASDQLLPCPSRLLQYIHHAVFCC